MGKDSLRLRDQTIAAVTWASVSFPPGTCKRAGADALVHKLRRADVALCGSSSNGSEVDGLNAFAEATRSLNARMHAEPSPSSYDTDNLMSVVRDDATAADFVTRPAVTFDEIRWVLNPLRTGSGDLASQIQTLLVEMDSIEHLAA